LDSISVYDAINNGIQYLSEIGYQKLGWYSHLFEGDPPIIETARKVLFDFYDPERLIATGILAVILGVPVALSRLRYLEEQQEDLMGFDDQ
jgi:hypothetical protein